MTKLYVGNLPYSYNEDSIKELFAAYGELQSVTVIFDKMTGRSKGFGFVELDDESAKKAIDELNNKDVEGRNIVVNVARPLEDRPRRDFHSGGGDRRGGSNGGFKKRY